MNVIDWNYPIAGFDASFQELPDLPAGYTWYNAAFFGDCIIAMGYSGSNWITAKLTSISGAWQLGVAIDLGIGTEPQPSAIARSNSGLYVCNIDNDLSTVFISTSGLTWTARATDLPAPGTFDSYSNIGVSGDAFYAVKNVYGGGNYSRQLYRSVNGCINWSLEAATPTADHWAVWNAAPTQLGDVLYLPSNRVASVSSDPYCIYDGFDIVIGSQSANGGYGSVNSRVENTSCGALFVYTNPSTNNYSLGLKKDAASPFYTAAEYYLGGYYASSCDDGPVVLWPTANQNQHIRLFKKTSDTEEIYSITSFGGAVNQTVADWFLDKNAADPSLVGGTLGTAAIVPATESVGGALKFAAVDFSYVPARPDVSISSLPAKVADIVADSRFGSGYDMTATSADARAKLRDGAVVLNIAVPPGAKNIVLQISANVDPDVYMDIFAKQNSNYEELRENYDAPYYGYFYEYEGEPELHTHTIPVSGTDTLTVVMQTYDALEVGVSSFDVSVFAEVFWTDLKNCEMS